MSDSVVLVVDFEKICRLCLHSTGAMSDIFESCGETSLSELIFCATGLEIQQNDGLPSRICHKCRFIVELACELQSTATKANTLLEKAAENIVRNSENIENEEKQQHNNLEVLENPTFAHMETAVVPNEEKYEINTKWKELDVTNISKEKENTVSLTTSLKLTEPSKRKTAPKHLTCQICLSPFPSEKHVEAHVDTHYEGTELTPYLQLNPLGTERPFECEQCKDGIISKKQLIVHHREHLGVNPFTCKHAGCSFVGKNQDSLRHHGIVHSVRTHVCEWCGAAFKRPWELSTHRARHRNERPARNNARPLSLSCLWRGCPKQYRSASALRAHRRAHLCAKLYVCTICQVARYTSQSLLNRHMRMHGRGRVSKCDQCPLVFAEYAAFYRHRVTSHGAWQPHRCHGCHQGYRDEVKLQKHMQMCELAIQMKPYIEAADKQTQHVPNLHESTDSEVKSLQYITADDLVKGQSLLIHNNIEVRDSLGPQDLPSEGLLYIEVDSNEEVTQPVWQH